MCTKAAITNVLLFAMVTVMLVSCAKVYWKDFVVETPTKSINAEKSIQLDGFEMIFFVHAGGNSSKILTDSTFFVTIRIESSDDVKEKKVEFCNAFTLTNLAVGIQGADERISLGLVRHEILSHSYYFEEVVIPEEVDTIYLHMLYDHLGPNDTIRTDSADVRLVRYEGHYSVFLGSLMN